MKNWRKKLPIPLLLISVLLIIPMIPLNLVGPIECISNDPFQIRELPVEFCPETRANNYTTNSQSYPSICQLTNETFVIAWTSTGQDGNAEGVYATVFDVTGANLTKEFRVNTYTTNAQYDPSVSRLNDTTFVVVWTSYLQDGDTYGVYGRVFDDTGRNLTNEFRVNRIATMGQLYPAVSGLTATSFVVVWANATAALGWDIAGTVMDNTGNFLGSDFLVNTYTFGWQSMPSVSRLTDSTFVVGWTSQNQDGDSYGVYGTILNNVGTKLTSEIQFNKNTTGEQNNVDVSRLTDTTFVATWHSAGQDGDGMGVFASVFDNSGNNLTNEFQANSYTTSHQQTPSVTQITEDSFIIAWESALQDPLYSSGVYARIFDGAGCNLTNEFRVNDYTNDIQGLPDTCRLSETDFVVAWASGWQDTDQYGVYFRGFSYEDAPPQSNQPSGNSYLANSVGHTIDWILTDHIGTGNYTVLKNGSTHVAWDSWDNNTNLQVPVDTNCGIGLWNYTIYFNDSKGTFGTPSLVWIELTAHPPTCNSPDNATYLAQTVNKKISWVITDVLDTSGWYRVFKNNSLYLSWSNWTIGINLNVTVDTSKVGTWKYIIQYNDSQGFLGTNGTVWITINPHPPTCNNPSNATYKLSESPVYIDWFILDEVDDWGTYRVFRNDSLYDYWSIWTTWENGQNLSIWIDSEIGTWKYVIQYNDSQNFFGINGTVWITITSDDTNGHNPIPSFNFSAVSLIFILVVAVSIALRRKHALFRKFDPSYHSFFSLASESQ